MEDYQNLGQEVNLLQPKRINDEHRPPISKGRFLLFLILIALIFFGANCAYRRYSIAKLPGESAAYDPITLKPKKIGFLQAVKNFVFHSNNFLEGQSSDRINILLLGMGGPGHDGPYLTDTNIIVSVKPSTNEVAMTSVPRDLGVEIAGEGLRKINYANSIGETQQAGEGGEYARQIFAQTFNMDIPYYIRVDFKAFQEIIDAVGGINVNVPRSFTDVSFPGANESYITVSFNAGPQVMLGERALQYARSRHGNNGEASDFARSKRQQLILTALKEKLLSIGTYTNPIKIEKILQSLSTHVTTNLDFGQIMYLASIARDMDNNIKTLVLDNGENGFLINANTPTAGFTLLPKTGNFEEINKAVDSIFLTAISDFSEPAPAQDTETPAVNFLPSQDNQSIFPTAKIEIQNGTWTVGLAGRYQKKLEESGFSVNKIGNSIKRPIATSTLFIINQNVDTEVVANLKNLLKTEFSSALPEWLATDYDNPATQEDESGLKYLPDTDLLIILGENIKE